MDGKGKHLQLVKSTGQVLTFTAPPSAGQAEIVYLRSLLQSNMACLAEYRAKFLELQQQFKRLNRSRLSAVHNENQGSDPGKKS